MSKKNKKKDLIEDTSGNQVNNQYPLTASYKIMNNCGPVPVARPADFIQLTPIVQTIIDVHVIQYEDSDE
ncbi:MAG: hypothetical protein LBF12_01255 [Christensenellaceae bacterium]|jgi:hypothetical protein|nr:hypothetical protein [Christensenellaceae bacterium]